MERLGDRMENNICIQTDSYKVSHWKQYQPDTERIYSYFESRGGRFDDTNFFGLQMILLCHLVGQVVTEEKINKAHKFWFEHFGADYFNIEGWKHILEQHGGRLPLSIKAVREGNTVSNRNVLMTVVNTDEKVPWLTNWVETLLAQSWYPSTVSTLDREIKKVLLEYLHHTGSPSQVYLKLHDFGFRGSTSPESAGRGGCAHLVNFMGTDTSEGLRYAMEYYGGGMPGFSIPAAEHSTICSWGRSHEYDAFANILKQFPTGYVACVSDSYDIYKACKTWGTRFKDQILARDGCLVIRPDSGDPAKVCLQVMDILWDHFGGEYNSKGYRVLDPHVRIIQGDGIKWRQNESGDPYAPLMWEHTIGDILHTLMRAKYSADNIAFGSGGGLLQQMDRDTQNLAFKCSATKVKNQWYNVFKDPVTQKAKHSKAGIMKLLLDPVGGYTTVDANILGVDHLQEVYRNGKLLVHHSFEEVRKRAEIGLHLEPATLD
jgi:nicotinamide phosphoribosyltransferase